MEGSIELLRRTFPDVAEETCERIAAACVSRAIELSEERMFTSNWNNPRFAKLYCNIVRNVIVALRKRHDLMANINNATLDPAELVRIPASSLFADVWNQSVTAHGKRMEHAYEKRLQAKTTAYRCSKCKQTNCDFTELQLRSADESMTTFVTCLTCNHAWRIG